MNCKITKIISYIILIAMCATLLSSCKSQPLTPGKDSLEIVGTVGDFEVKYDELYFLASNYKKELDGIYGEDASTSDKIINVDDNGTSKEVVLSEYYFEQFKNKIYKNIVSNYAVLTLCKEANLLEDTETVKENVQKILDDKIKNDFNSKRSDYKKYLKSNGLTDNYVRFLIGVDALYSGLRNEYLKNGILNDDESFIREKINTEFIRTWHIMIKNSDGDSKNLKKAQEALDKINGGESMYRMIGSKYNEDLLMTTLDGYYFTKGIMDESYEEAAYGLDINEISGIVESTCQDERGNIIDCYYIIQRLPLEDKYINTHFEKLKKDYLDSEIYKMVSELKKTLKFVPNDYYKSLDILSLEEPTQSDPRIIITSVAVAASSLAVIGITVLVVYKVKSRNKKILAIAKSSVSNKKH